MPLGQFFEFDTEYSGFGGLSQAEALSQMKTELAGAQFKLLVDIASCWKHPNKN